MDVDGGALNSDQHDLEQSLLQEFSRMGTRDKDDLISQMQKLLGPELTHNSATFFLDMNNWNLQDAVCSYLDFVPTIMMPDLQRPVSPLPLPAPLPCPPPGEHEMALMSPKGQYSDPHPPGTQIEWVWIVKNTGDADWPEGCVVVSEDSSQIIAQLPVVKTKDVFFIKYNLTMPPCPGVHSMMFRLCTPLGRPFGEELWLRLRVQDNTGAIQEMEQVDENM